MSFIGYIKNNQDFCQLVDLLDLVDVKEITKDELKVLDDYKLKTGNFNTSKVITLCKYPAYTKTKNEDYYLKNAISYNLITTGSPEQFFLVDNETKQIIIDFSKLEYLFSRINSTIFFKGNDKIFKTNIDDYEIKSFEYIKEELLDTINKKQNQLITEYKDKLYNIAKAQVDEDKLKQKAINDAKHNYILDKKVEDDKPNIDYLFNADKTIYSKFNDNCSYFIFLYMRDKQKLLDITEQEFIKIIHDNSYHTEFLSLKLYIYEKQKEISDNIKKTLESDEELNKLKEIVNILKQAGKTVVINGDKYKNNIIKTTGYEDIKVGAVDNKYILLSDIKTIMFGKKLLYSAI